MKSEDYKNGELFEISGTVEHIIFHNEDNGYTVFDISCNQKMITAVGTVPFINEGEKIKAVGSFKNHASFGKQFQIDAYERSMPEDKNAIYKYLSSGVIKGVGKVIAKRIVDTFKEDTLDILENHPEKLLRVKGITKAKAEKLSLEFRNIAGLREIMLYFLKFSVTAKECIRIWKALGFEAIQKVEDNPYIICSDDIDISFEKAEIMARQLSKPLDDVLRIQYGIVYVIKHNMANGHTCLPKDKLLPLCVTYLQVPIEAIDEQIGHLNEDKKIKLFTLSDRDFIALYHIFESEKSCAERLLIMLSYPPCEVKDFSKKLEHIEKTQNISYAQLQKEAIKHAAQKGLLIMTGGPGTGKTTTIRAIIDILEQNKEKVLLAAPTGRAAKRMSEVTGKEAKTIHRLLCAEFDEKDNFKFTKNEKNPLKCDALILDELSMVDVKMLEAVLRALPLNCRLIMVGDSDQLPSVGAGNVLKDMISSNKLPVVRLNEIFRQSMKSLIVTNAHKIVNGEYPNLTTVDKDFFFLDKFHSDEVLETVSDLYIRRLPTTYKYNPLEDIQILTPGRKGRLGSIEINKYVQERINPKAPQRGEVNKNGFVLREGDKVMQIKNNYDIKWARQDGTTGAGIFNGDIGIIQFIDRKTKDVLVYFEDKQVLYKNDEADDLELAYATTVHKAQGSEFKAVIIPMMLGAKQLYYRNLLYTAVTRAKDMLVMVGLKKVVRMMVDNDKRTKRYTALSEFLKGNAVID